MSDESTPLEVVTGPDDTLRKVSTQSWLERAALLFLAELPYERIAQETGKPYAIIAQLPSLPEFRNLIQVYGISGDAKTAKKLIRQSQTDNVLTLIRIRDDVKVKPETRVKCAMYLLDREMGKPVESTKRVHDQTPAELFFETTLEGVDQDAQIEHEIQNIFERYPELRQQLKPKPTTSA